MRTACPPATPPRVVPSTYEPPAFLTGAHPAVALEESPVATFVATIAVILAFFGSTAAWCWFVCRRNGGVRSCSVGWYSAKARCRR
jgi:hypothetical protein